MWPSCTSPSAPSRHAMCASPPNPAKFTRCGIGSHSCPAVAGRQDHDNYKSWEYEDAHLTDFGWKQVCPLQEGFLMLRRQLQAAAE